VVRPAIAKTPEHYCHFQKTLRIALLAAYLLRKSLKWTRVTGGWVKLNAGEIPNRENYGTS
jgi:hypothetical protein